MKIKKVSIKSRGIYDIRPTSIARITISPPESLKCGVLRTSDPVSNCRDNMMNYFHEHLQGTKKVPYIIVQADAKESRRIRGKILPFLTAASKKHGFKGVKYQTIDDNYLVITDYSTQWCIATPMFWLFTLLLVRNPMHYSITLPKDNIAQLYAHMFPGRGRESLVKTMIKHRRHIFKREEVINCPSKDVGKRNGLVSFMSPDFNNSDSACYEYRSGLRNAHTRLTSLYRKEDKR